MTFFVAFAAGAAVAALALILESLSLVRTQVSPPAIAVYAAVGGFTTAIVRLVLSRFVPAEAARLAAVTVALAIVWANALYFVNVSLLAGEPYFSAKSLLSDTVLLIPYAALLFWIARSRWLKDRRERGRLPLAALGLATMGWSAFVLSGHIAGADLPKRRAADSALPDIVLVILDSARRDHLGFQGYSRATSPALGAWASRGRVYDTAFAASSWTVPTVASLLTVPGTSRDSGVAVVDVLVRRGYTSACFTDNPHLTPGSPLTEHFDLIQRSVGRWRDPLRRTLLGEIVERVDSGNDEELVDRALAWVRAVGGPKFLYVHLMDSHTPYRFAPLDGKRRSGRRIEFPRSGMSMTPEEREDVVARYDAGLRSASDQAARLLAGIESLERPFVAVVTSDHGESLGEESRWFHGTGLFPELLAVPLFAVGEGVTPGRVASTIGHSSVTLTLLSLARIPCEGCDGSDLRASDGDPWVHGELPPHLRYTIGLGHKLVMNGQDKLWHLYSLAEDPSERNDLARSRTDIVRRLAEQRPPFSPPVDAETLDRLRAIGYVGTGK